MKIKSTIQSPASLGNSARAFTLVELLVVITIIAVLTGIIISMTRTYIERAAMARIAGSMREVNAAFYSYLSDHNDRLPGYTNAGLQSPVAHAFNPQGTLGEFAKGGGGWNDFGNRLGNQLFSYLDSSEDNHTVKVLSLLSDPRWVKEMNKSRPGFMDNNNPWPVSMAVNTLIKRKDFPELTDDFEPFGRRGDLGGGDDGAPNGVTPCNMALVSARLPLSRTWWLTQADFALPAKTNIDANDLNAALPYPLFKSRVTAFFDGSVRMIPVGTDMTKPL